MSSEADKARKIIHVDMDAYYASVEQRDTPELRGKPVIVGGDPQSRGVVAACSYEARTYGIHSAMAAAEAYRRCPQAVFVRPRFSVYREISLEIRKIFRRYTDLVEPLSLDEAYLDVTACQSHQGSATLIAQAIKAEIKSELALVASAGISYNKFLAKIASDVDKPDGLFVITPEQGATFIEQLPIRTFFGIGPATERRMKSLGIFTGADLKRWSREQLQKRFGKTGRYYYDIARGVDERAVHSTRVRKSLSTETTFAHDLDDRAEMLAHLERLAGQVIASLESHELDAHTINIKVRYSDFTLITRAQTLNGTLCTEPDLVTKLRELLSRTEAGARKVRLLGVCAANLFSNRDSLEVTQLLLF